jgi:G3E family GTPase
LAAVVTAVDAVNALETLDNHEEAVKQVGVADLILFTKTDLAPVGALSVLQARLGKMNPGAKTARAINGEIEPTEFFNHGLYRPGSKTVEVQDWLNAEAYDVNRAHSHSTHVHTHEHEHEHGITTEARNRHGDRIKAYCVTREHPISWAGFTAWLEMVSGMRGNDLLRVKGIINVLEHPARPIVIHGVQHIFHPPIQLDAWPSEDHRTRIVFITRDIDQDVIDQTLRVFERRAAKQARAK